ncbi:hypothetical protein ACH5RR_039332 [Cinchona calisaya]|uniref:Uncharacterized protein n=1 Tax=Cinchona calisaya TaxID=153742 RepID=A0ABD2Y3D2_9GENT
MDKNNKNRTDLLAAGRKKLQQFRQKKDGKGGKFSGKSGKPGHDAGDDAPAKSTETSERGVDGEISLSNATDVVSSSELQLLQDSVLVDNNVANVDQSSKDGTGETTSAMTDENFILGDSGRGNKHDTDDTEVSVPFEGGGVSDGCKDVELGDSRTLDTVISEEKSTSSNMPMPVDLLSKVERHGEEQVTDVGAAREAGCSGWNQTDPGSEMRPERVVPVVGITVDINAAVHEAGQCTQPDDVASAEVRDEQMNDAFGSSSEAAQVENIDEHDYAKASVGFEDDSLATFIGSNMLQLPSGSDTYSISLSQLAEVIKGLDKEMFRFLFCSRELPIEFTNSLCLNTPEFFNFLGRLKEQLYLTSIARDANQLQLSEQLELEMQLHNEFEKLVGEISVSSASIQEVQRKNDILSEELNQCRSEIREFCSEREELRQQLHGSKAEVKDFSAKVDDLKNKLEISGGNLASLASELTDCRNLVASLQVQNENLNGTLISAMEEKINVVEHKEHCLQEKDKMAAELAQCKASLASLQSENVDLSECLTSLKEEKRKFDKEKECLVCENGKLLSDLVGCNDLAEALGVENANLSGIVTSLEQKNRNLELAQEYLVQENEKLALEFVNNRILIEGLQMEMSNIDASLASLMEERDKLEEEKQCLLTENESGSCELVDSKVVLAGLQTEFSKTMRDLKEASLHIEMLSQENVLLRTNLELYISRMTGSEETANQSKDSDGQNTVSNDNLIPRSEESEAASEFRRTSSESPAHGSLPTQTVRDDPCYSSGSEYLKMHLEANEVLQKLEKAIKGMHSLSAFFSRSSGKDVPSGVSKLILAFETKSHTDEHEIPEVLSSENAATVDPYAQAKEQTENLQVVLKQMLLHAESASKLFEAERKSRISAEFLNTELKACCESLKSDCNHLEEENIELAVLCEALKQHICNSETSVRELVMLCNALQEQQVTLDAENIQLKEKLSSFDAKISEFQSHLYEICQSSDQMISSISNRAKTLQEEVGDGGSILDEEWNSFVDQKILEVGKIDMSIETLCSFTFSTDHRKSLDVGRRIAASFVAASKVIEGLQEQLTATQRDHQATLSSYSKLNIQFNNLQEKNELFIDILDKIYRNLRSIVELCGRGEESQTGINKENLLDTGVFNDLLGHLENILDEKLLLESTNDKLSSDLVDQVREIDELKRRCFHLDSILTLFKNVQEEFRFDCYNINIADPVLGLESFINILIQNYKEAKERVSLSMEKPALNEVQLSYFQEELDYLSFMLVQYENENLILKESWKAVIEDIPTLQAELQGRVAELEQSEHRVSSLREKLSIAVTKGKGLIVQRDSLKQSLAETSNQLDKYSQDLQLKDVMIHELETKLQNYSEAGERMEALKSELAYIRNSATALRESFLLKDSILQRIEEILEDLDVPEQFHSRDIIEKVDWLAKSMTVNTPCLSDWDQRSSVGGSYPENRLTVDGWKEETLAEQDSADEFRRRYEELQSKFYGLAEQNEMLEQSLIERNNLVQRWEEILGKIEMPLQLQSLEPEDRIQWLGGALSDTQNHCNSLQQRIDYLDTLNGSLTGDLEEHQNRISELESAYHSIIVEKEHLLKNLESFTNDHHEFTEKASQLETENKNLLKQVTSLQEQLDQKLLDEERFHHVETEARRLQDLIRDVLQDSVMDDSEFHSESMEYLEQLLRKLIEKYSTLLIGNMDVMDVQVNEKASPTHHEERTRDSGVALEDVAALSNKLEDTLGKLEHLKEERDRYLENNQSLVSEVEALDVKKKQLQDLLNHEDQKSASLREKLNMAVKKGKSLVQQRDNLKQVIDEVNAEVDRLKSEVSLHKNSIAEYEHKITNLSISHERIKNIESECVFLRDRLADNEHCLQEKDHMLSLILDCLKVIEVDFDLGSGNPVQKLEAIGKHYLDLRVALDASLQESRKSKRAAELLLAELNEVQERNDALQEDLAKVSTDLTEVSRENELFEAAKSEALAHLEKLSAIQSEEKDHLLAEVSLLRSGLDQIREEISTIHSSIADVLSKDLEILQDLEVSIKSCLEPVTARHMDATSAVGSFSGIVLPKSENKVFMIEIGFIKEQLQRHYDSVREEASHIFEVLNGLYAEVASLKESSECKERDLRQIKSILKDRDSELYVARRNISLLYEACTSSIMEIENWKSQQVGIGFPGKAPWMDLNSPTFVAGSTFTEERIPSSEEVMMLAREKLLSVVKDLISRQNEILEVSQNELKTVVGNLQKELHEKDIQRDRICVELVNQIKDAEIVAKNYWQDLQSATNRANDLQNQVNVMEEKHSMLEKRVKELEYRETVSVDLQLRVDSLTDALSAKNQEIEALIQALDEGDSQMEGLSNKIMELENYLQKKNQDLENLEASRGKILKKLSVTVSKFDELHHLSENLLSEVEKRQSQLQERDGEISFLRQEVTRCTNEALTATQMSNKRNSDEILELLRWLDTIVSRVQVHDMPYSDAESNQVDEHKVLLQKQIDFIVSELEELRTVAQNRDLLLKLERSRVEELIRKEEFLENALLEKESQLTMLRRIGDSGQASSPNSEIVEVESLINKRAAPGSIAPQVRGGRKTNSDQVAIAIDIDPTSGIEDDDDDKAHGFKSLTTSRIIPRFTRPVSDMIDGLWMSCDRALMRQPTLRLGVIIYWAILHALLATFVV